MDFNMSSIDRRLKQKLKYLEEIDTSVNLVTSQSRGKCILLDFNNIADIQQQLAPLYPVKLNKKYSCPHTNTKMEMKMKMKMRPATPEWKEYNFTPIISDHAKNLQSDPASVFDRLYPSEKSLTPSDPPASCSRKHSDYYSTSHSSIGTFSSPLLVKKNLTNDIIEEENSGTQKINTKRLFRPVSCKYKEIEESEFNSKFPFKPELNEKSRKMARELEPSLERLMKKKKKRIADNKTHNALKEHNFERFTNLYAKGVEMMKKKEQERQDFIQKQIQNEEKFPFQPNVNQMNSEKKFKSNTTHTEHDQSKGQTSMYEQNKHWIMEKENNRIQAQKKIDIEEGNICKFHPDIKKNIMKDNEKLILQQVDYMNDYVSKRRNFITTVQRHKREDELKYCYCNRFIVSSKRKIICQLNSKIPVHEKKDISYFRSLTPSRVLSERNTNGVEDFYNEDEEDFRNRIILTIKKGYGHYGDSDIQGFKDAVREINKSS